MREISEDNLSRSADYCLPSLAIVVIGRNEGQRLASCLESIRRVRNVAVRELVYVDSGSADGSPQYAASMGCRVVELDPSRPFSAARARNEGYAWIMEHDPDVPFIQFLDGDCDLVESWLEQGLSALIERPDVGVVCGHVRELYPSASVYNQLCDLEWQQAPGELRSSGGRFLIRTELYRAAGGFRPDVIAAEDDEFCVRVRRTGAKILQVDAEMARHDLAMTRFSQWWRRSKRTGHAFAHVSALHGQSEDRYFVADCRRIWLWALLLPLIALALAPFTYGLSVLLLACAYGLQFLRTYVRGRQRGWSARQALIYSFFTFLFKFPALTGLLEFYWRQWRGQVFTIIEYKGSS
jgi:glycosyltransferase involved in cell wall biosynthesis